MTEYDFRNLSPIDFEALIRDLIGAEEDIVLETYATGPDGGIDCRFQDNGRLVVVQCKHRPGATKAQIKKSVEQEIESLLEKRSDEIESANQFEYHFVTSADLSPGTVDEIQTIIRQSLSAGGKVWARGGINSLLARHNLIERRHFKLWLNNIEVLKSIVGTGEWQRNESLIHNIKTRVSIYVDTPKYADAIKTLSSENIVIISGAPGVGKSTLSEMLLLAHWEAGWKVVDLVNDISGAWSHITDGSAEKVIFYYDDFLGQTSSVELQKNEGGDLGRVIGAIKRSDAGNYRLVMTTREQILNSALSGPDDRIRNALNWIDKIRVDLTELSRVVKARMLFNHLYFGYESASMRDELSRDSRYFQVIDHRGFNPRVLESVVLIKKPNSVEALYGDLIGALVRPDDIWLGSFDQLSSLAVRIIMHLAVRTDRAVQIGEIEGIFTDCDPRDFTNALRVLENTWIKIEKSNASTSIRLYDPSRKDFLLGRLDGGLMVRQAVLDANALDQIELIMKHLEQIGIKRFSTELRQLLESCSVAILKTRLSEEGEDALARRAVVSRSPRDVSIASVLSSFCNIVARISSDSAIKEALEVATRRLDKDWPWRRVPSSNDLFDLADSLLPLPDEWALDRAINCAQIAIENMSSIEDLERFIDSRDSFANAVGVELNGDHEVQSVLDDEIFAIGYQSDRDLMEQMLAGVEEFASMNGFLVDVDSAVNAIESVPRTDYRGRSVGSAPMSENVALDDSDELIDGLFDRLRE